MSGHITKMSRGCRVASSASRPSRTSLSTSTCRAEPWQLCTWTDRSSSASIRPSRTNRVGADVGLQPAQKRVGFAARFQIFVDVRVGGNAACSSRRSRPRVASSGCSAMRWLVSSRRGPHRDGASAATSRRWGAAATGEGHGGRPGRSGARSRWAAAGCGRKATAAPADRSVIREAAQRRCGVPDVGRVGVDVVDQRAPQRGCQAEGRNRCHR